MLELPELSNPTQIVRIPSELDVPITDRIRALLDTRAMQRLKHISQLGLVSAVYPGAVHSRFEHSLGVYRMACIVLKQLSQVQPEAIEGVTADDIKIFVIASLLHDIGHWPYCHPIEDMNLAEVPTHEQAARRWILDSEMADVIQTRWEVAPAEVADFLSSRSSSRNRHLLQSVLNGPVDIDKMDYLQRDSLHAGVPYGRNFDVSRLVSSLRLGSNNDLTITPKGKTAAEMMVFSRYVMFSEVYWHHGVRSATAMLQRAVFRLFNRLDCDRWGEMSEAGFRAALLHSAASNPSLNRLCQGLFGPERRLYKRLEQFNFATAPEVHSALAHRPFEELIACAQQLSTQIERKYSIEIGPDALLIDAPPVHLEIQFRLNVETNEGHIPLADISPVVQALATSQFDQFVKMIRIFVAPELRQRLQIPKAELQGMLLDAAHSIVAAN